MTLNSDVGRVCDPLLFQKRFIKVVSFDQIHQYEETNLRILEHLLEDQKLPGQALDLLELFIDVLLVRHKLDKTSVRLHFGGRPRRSIICHKLA